MTAAIALLLAAATPEAWPELPVAEGRTGPWRMSVATYVNPRETPPTIANIRCSIRRRGFSLLLNRHGGMQLLFGGDGTGFSIVRIKAVTIGAARWEARLVPLPAADRYSDIDYPAGHPESAGTADNYLGVRRDEGEPWLHLVSLVDELAEGRTLAVEHESGTYRLSLAGLSQALRWCTAVMESERARRFSRR
ncbi:MAG: hypothetical protein ABWX67_07660 [Allosphingosinicella sp.]